MELYPLKFSLQGMDRDYIWGGQKLRLLGKPCRPVGPVAEIWEIADRPQDNMVSIIDNGDLKGTTIRQLMCDHRLELLGKAKAQGDYFPLLVKIIDAKETLSVQVHPTDKAAKSLASEPKTESWLVLNGSDSDARVWSGLKQKLTKNELASYLSHETIAGAMACYQALPDDIFFIPSGTIHAIGSGCLILEVQENSNTTYRLYDWGRGRELHLKEAMIAIDLNNPSPKKIINKFLKNNLFSLRVKNKPVDLKTNNAFAIIFNLQDQLTISYKNMIIELGKFETCLVPAICKSVTIKGNNPKYALIKPTSRIQLPRRNK